MFNLINIFSFTLVCVLALTNHASADAEDCVLPPPPENGFLEINGVLFGRHEFDDDQNFTIEHMERVYFSCDADYEISGMKSTRCYNGRLRSEVPLCVKSFCGPPPTVENGEVAKAIYKPRKRYPVSCFEGYRFKVGYPNAVVCRRNGTDVRWYTKLPVCEKIPDCGDPGFPKSGHRLGDSFLAGQSLTFSCKEELELIGEPTITCQESGQWDFPRPRCKPNLSCPDPPNSPSTIYKSPNQTSDYFVPGDWVEISCDEGYTLEGETDYVLCYLDEDDLDSSEFEVEPECRNLQKCISRHMLNVAVNASLRITTPVWNDAFPTCTKIECGLPKIPKYGFVRDILAESTDQAKPLEVFPYNYEFKYACQEGFQLIGINFATCMENGWTPEAPRCKRITCSSRSNPQNGLVSTVAGKGWEIGDVLQFGCFSGYTLAGTEQSICLENGQWSGELAKCNNDETYCPEPGTPLRGSKSGNDYNFGAVVVYTCGNDYTLVGSSSRTCLENRTWSGTDVECKSFMDFDRNNELQYRLFSSVDSDVLIEDSMDHNGINHDPISNRTLPNPELVSGPTGRVLDVTHPNGNYILYFVFDTSKSVGRRNFILSVDFVIALVKRIGVSRDGVRVGGMAFGNNVDVKWQFLPLDFTKTEDVVKGLIKIKEAYSNGGTNIFKALDHLHMDVVTTVQANPNIKNPKSHVFLLSDGVYNEGGSPVQVVNKMKTMGMTFSAVAISGDKTAQKGIDTLYKIASQRSNVYHLKDYDNLREMVDDVLTNRTDYSRCGVPVFEVKAKERGPNDPEVMGRIFGGTVVKTYWPWMAMLQNNNNTRKMFKGSCGGSLINKDWILTAAHCINPYPNETLNATEIRVLLGFTHDNDTRHVQAATPVRIFMHEKFNITDQSKPYDYDVALLKLEHSVQYEKRIRPVCLSPPDKDIPKMSPLYQETTAGWLIGYGQFNATGKKNENFLNLREVPLDVGRNHTCSEGLVASKTVYTDQMFCAGGQLGKNFCSGDSGSPFMKNQYHSDGSGYWIQTGIVSFTPSKDCGVEGEYGYYTKLSSVREWIDNIIKKN